MTLERWQTFSLAQQLGHIGSEITRARGWSTQNDLQSKQAALERGLHLLDLTLDDRRWRNRARELARLREVVADHLTDKQSYDVSLRFLEDYCFRFTSLRKK